MFIKKFQGQVNNNIQGNGSTEAYGHIRADAEFCIIEARNGRMKMV
jgi:hypothetical protein